MKLISMTDYVLKINDNEPKAKNFSSFTEIANYKKEGFEKIFNYAKFLKQPLTLGMFVPCDEDGNVMEEPNHFPTGNNTLEVEVQNKKNQFQQAKERVLFEGFEVDFSDGVINPFLEQYPIGFYDLKEWVLSDKFKTIEDLTPYNLTLTNNVKL